MHVLSMRVLHSSYNIWFMDLHTLVEEASRAPGIATNGARPLRSALLALLLGASRKGHRYLQQGRY